MREGESDTGRFQAEVQTAGDGEAWSTNGLRFKTMEHARSYVTDLALRWTAVTRCRVVLLRDEGSNLVVWQEGEMFEAALWLLDCVCGEHPIPSRGQMTDRHATCPACGADERPVRNGHGMARWATIGPAFELLSVRCGSCGEADRSKGDHGPGRCSPMR